MREIFRNQGKPAVAEGEWRKGRLSPLRKIERVAILQRAGFGTFATKSTKKEYMLGFWLSPE